MAHHHSQQPGGGAGAAGAGEEIKEQDRQLPIANVGRIMKQILPPNAKVSKEAKETMQECVSEFISFVTGEAGDKCQKEKRKTLNGEDVCWAFCALGFDDYVDPMRRHLDKYREFERQRTASTSRREAGGPPDCPTTSGSGAGAEASGSGSGHFMLGAMDRNDSNSSRPF
ncbi:unnamed protein product [Urochloa decumbens]|uniref:Transcription factor CBF/NF-Y/archaeal histone domain-containing protein n=1 Tax=Urochloa decumbens TaxID=240449 RepID=A0ABC9B475_9POAL